MEADYLQYLDVYQKDGNSKENKLSGGIGLNF